MATSILGPYGGQYLGTLGLGLLQAAQPQPYGSNRMTYIADAMASANRGLLQSQFLKTPGLGAMKKWTLNLIERKRNGIFRETVGTVKSMRNER